MATFLKKLQNFDAYPKTLEDFRISTLSGAIVSIVAGLFITYLVLAEFYVYLDTEVHHELFVDTSRGQRLRINIDIIFPAMSCSYLGLDAMDVAGETQLDIDHSIYKQRLDSNGDPKEESPYKEQDLDGGAKALVPSDGDDPGCGSCYGAQTDELPCCNTCEEVREAYRLKGWAFGDPDAIAQCVAEGFTEKLKAEQDEGCEIYGYLTVSKASGNVHVAPGKSFQQSSMHVHDLQTFKHLKHFNMSHKIVKLSFGEEYVGMLNPLDGISKTWNEEGHKGKMYQYFVKVVPTSYHGLDGSIIETNQFSVTEYHTPVAGDSHGGHSHGHSALPGVFFMYEISPIKVQLAETQKSFAQFLTSVCAIVGGVFTVSGFIDSFIYHGMKSWKKKVELGKAH